MSDYDRFSDEYDPEPDYDRPTRAEAEAEADDDWVPSGWKGEPILAEDDDTPPGQAEYTGSTCPVCGADIPPHAPDCPAGAAEQPDEIGEDF